MYVYYRVYTTSVILQVNDSKLIIDVMGTCIDTYILHMIGDEAKICACS